jgi:hypothetical protein
MRDQRILAITVVSFLSWVVSLGAEIIEVTPIGFADEVREIAVAPDQNHAVFLTSGGSGEGLWWAPIDGSADPVLLSGTSTNLSDFAVAPGSDRVAFTAFASGLVEVWVTPVSTPAPVKVSTPSASGRAEDLRFSDDGARVLYREGPNGGARRLWSAPADGVGPAVPISGADDNCGRFELVGDGFHVLFHSYQPTVDRSELFRAPVDGSEAPEVLSLFPGDPEDPNDEELQAIVDWDLTANGGRVVYVAQRNWPDDPGNLAVDLELYSVAVAGPSGSEIRLDLSEPVGHKDNSDRTEAFATSPDGGTVVFRYQRNADHPDDTVEDSLFAVPVDRASEPVEIASNADHVFSFDAGTARAIYLGGDTTIADSLRSVPFVGGGPTTLDGDPVSSRVIGDDHQLTADGVTVVYPVGSERAIWAVAIDGAGGPREITPWLGFSGDVQPDVLLSPDSTTAIYRSDLELDGTYELYASALATGGAVKLNDPPTTGRRVFDVAITADSRCVLFASESSSTAPRRLFAADLNGGCAENSELFSDGFEGGGLQAWSDSIGGIQ